MKNQEIGLTGSSTTSEMLTYLSDNLARASSFLSYVILHFSDSKLFLQALRVYPLLLVIVSLIRAACKLAGKYL